jgi:hypothetical protein
MVGAGVPVPLEFSHHFPGSPAIAEVPFNREEAPMVRQSGRRVDAENRYTPPQCLDGQKPRSSFANPPERVVYAVVDRFPEIDDSWRLPRITASCVLFASRIYSCIPLAGSLLISLSVSRNPTWTRWG